MKFVIVGNGVAGITVARFLSENSPENQVIIYTAEQFPYYPRPRLPEFLAGEIAQEELYFYPPEWYEQRRIIVHLGTPIEGLDRAAKQVLPKGKPAEAYDRLLLASGGYAFVPPIEGKDQQGVFVLRTLQDALNIRAYAQNVHRAIVIGGGLLGMEAARGLRKLGLEVTVLESAPYCLPRQLDAKGASVFEKYATGLGLKILTHASCEAILGNGSVSGIRLTDGRTLDGEIVLISTGVRSNVALAKEAGLVVNKGVVVDEHLTTSDPAIFAAGDVAEFKGQVWGIIPAAIDQARVAWQNMISPNSASYQGTVPSNTLKIVGIDLTTIGKFDPEGEPYQVYRRVGEEKGIYKKLVLQDGVIVGTILLGDKRPVGPISRLIQEGRNVSAYAEHLLDDDFDFNTIA
ncbi:MAG: NAD(P)/FAD-dependent oxidoreductase [Chloroflexi bacterium]|nr:NAD(P)/FAD-dependent oxidoreductase [Chloroflexota bacterium]